MVDKIIQTLNLTHIPLEAVFCFRSRGSKAKFTVARIHGLGRIWQKVFTCTPCYLIEVIAERFDELLIPEKEKILIHELLHIPHGFSGGFRHHKGYINNKIIDQLHKKLRKRVVA